MEVLNGMPGGRFRFYYETEFQVQAFPYARSPPDFAAKALQGLEAVSPSVRERH